MYLMLRAAGTSPYAVHVLIGFTGVFGEIDASPEHASDIGVALVEPFLGDGLNNQSITIMVLFYYTI